MPVTTIDEVIDRLIVLFDAVSGINSAVDGWPNEPISSASLPMVVIVEGQAEYAKGMDNRSYDETRLYLATLLVGTAVEPTTGTDVAGRTTVRPYLKSLIDAFMSNLTLASGDAGLPNVKFARITRSSPPDKMDHAGTPYWGAYIEIAVTTNYRL